MRKKPPGKTVPTVRYCISGERWQSLIALARIPSGSRSYSRSRYWLGVMPVAFLKTVKKWLFV